MAYLVCDLPPGPEQCRWARERAGLETDAVARRVSKEYPLWESGKAEPDYQEIRRFEELTRVGVSYLQEANPPERRNRIVLPDFRPLATGFDRMPSMDLIDTIFACQGCQDWYSLHRHEQIGEAVGFVRTVTTRARPENAAARIRAALRFEMRDREALQNWTAAFSHIVDVADKMGVMVMISGVVEGNTHRRLNTEEFRALAIADEYAPLAFVNAADPREAQMRTLVHMLAHLWRGKSGISSFSCLEAERHTRAEQWCNEVALEVLAPRKELFLLSGRQAVSPDNAAGVTRRLSRKFKVSQLAIACKLFGEGMISREAFEAAYRSACARKAPSAIEEAKEGTAHSRNLIRRYGKSFMKGYTTEVVSHGNMFSGLTGHICIASWPVLEKLAEQWGIHNPRR